MLLTVVSAGHADFDFESIEGLTPGEQYRQLSLLMLVAGGVDPQLLALLEADNAAVQERANLKLDDFVTPLVRIVNPDTLLDNAAQMIRFAQQHRAEIEERMTAIVQANPILISMVDVNAIAADAIIIRNSIADSIEYSEVIDDPERPRLLENFRDQTIYLRNMMEYNEFQEKLASITNQAIIDLGGRLDAYQRMFNEDVDDDLIRRRVESAQIMNEQTGSRYEDQAMMRNTELLMMLILMESQVRR
ncbi:MAG: hypothetical protein HKN57_03555 [Xanthomonadales bacterium]|nr:hypothetical protein [Gammaproteobacteria bacterium]MBT8054077.1 hypothetical protein [Gammaproteobacteria bacterium]NND56305.1 hypothetical protein [Xanthomonadales bacterium]NNK51400.1 hypothetical protein [Xanthomonadales bacterium]